MGTWKSEETNAYNPFDHTLLRMLYDRAEIPQERPWRRAEYLAEGVLKTTQTDHDLLMRTASQEGRHTALNLLEQWAVVNFKDVEDPIAEIVRRGGYAQITLPNLNCNGYANGLYRIHGPVIEVQTDRERRTFDTETIPMPTRIEALREDEEWKEFPRVVLHKPFGESNGWSYYIFRANGAYHTMRSSVMERDNVFLTEAEKAEMLKGTTDHVRLFGKRDG